MGNLNNADNFDELRQSAERAIRKTDADIDQMPLKDIQRLIHELQVHQIELEMQNEELRNAQLQLQDSRDKYSELYEFAPVGYLSLDSEGVIQDANLTACRMFDVQRSVLVGSKFSRHVASDEQDKLYRVFRSLRSSKQPQTLELRILKKGQPVWTQFEGKVHNANLDKWFITLSDIGLRKHSEELLSKQEMELVHIDRINCMGQMVGGISHEIAQPLTAISSFASACEAKLTQCGTDQVGELIAINQLIAEQAIHAGEILHRLRSFIKPSNANHSKFGINDVINEALKLTASQTGYFNAKVNDALVEGLPDVVGDRVQIQQVVVNLLINAFESMVDKPAKERLVSIRTSFSEAGVEVSVEDNGEGLSSEIASKIFEVFFTTKSTGMGLGLAISRTIIESHSGTIWVTPKTDHGARFHFKLPRSEGGLDVFVE